MSKDTKIGLLIGVGVIFVIGIVVSDHLQESQRKNAPRFDAGALLQGSAARVVHDADRPPPAPDPLPLPDAINAADRMTPNSIPRAPDPKAPSPPIANPIRPELEIKSNKETPTLVIHPVGDNHTKPIDTANLNERAKVEPTPPDAPAPGNGPEAKSDNPGVDLDGQIIHYIKKGESLASISKQYFGDTQHVDLIFGANRHALKSKTAVRAGVRIFIPKRGGNPAPGSGATESNANNTTDKPTPTPPDAPKPEVPAPVEPTTKKPIEYTVQKGDTLYSIAIARLGSSRFLPKLIELNRDKIRNADEVAIGTILRLPNP